METINEDFYLVNINNNDLQKNILVKGKVIPMKF